MLNLPPGAIEPEFQAPLFAVGGKGFEKFFGKGSLGFENRHDSMPVT